MTAERRPRPKETGTLIGVRLQSQPLAALDAWIPDRGEPVRSRPEAVRRAMADHLRPRGYLPAANEAP